MTVHELQKYLSQLPQDLKVTVGGSPNVRLTKTEQGLDITWILLVPGSYIDDFGCWGEEGQFLQVQCDGKIKWVRQ